jgi:hypothetical protein
VRTAKLIATLFYILCPQCDRMVVKEDGSSVFEVGELYKDEELFGGRALRCTRDGCKKEFRLPATLKAGVEALPAEGALEEAEVGAAVAAQTTA